MKLTAYLTIYPGLLFGLLINTAQATYPPSFSDCTVGDGEEYEQVDACRQLIRSNKKKRELYVALGKALEKRQKHQQAMQVYKNALDVFPGDQYFQKKLSIANSNIKEQQWLDKKQQSTVKTSDTSKSNVQFKLNKLRCTRLTGDIALKACQTALKINSKDADLYNAQGDIYASQQKNKMALASYQSALKISPDNKDIYDKVQKLTQRQTLARQSSTSQTPADKIKAPEQNNQIVSKNQTDMALNPDQQQFLEQLNLLTSLRSQGIINETEYQTRKKALLDANFSVTSTQPAANNKANSSATIKKASTSLDGLKFGNYHALIIGNNNYKHLRKLKTAVNDARELADLLESDYGFKVKLLLNANRYDTLKAMGEYRRTLSKKDNLLIYYAGHGVLDKASERGYWLPIDAEQDFTSNWISTAEITDTLKALKSWHVLVVADSCYSGTLVRSAAVKISSKEEKHTLLTRLLKKKSRTVLTSGGLEPVIDSGGDNHSVFAQAFIDVLTENRDAIEAEAIFSRLRDKVILNADQTPEYSNVRKVGHNGGDFVFLRQ